MRPRILFITLLIAGVTSCGGDSTSPSAAATVALGGAPISPLLVGNSIQLTATALNSTGGTISNQSVNWRTSDRAVAGVSVDGRVTGVGPGTATITAAVGHAEGKAIVDVRAGGLVTTSGGTLTMLDGAVTVAIPAFALSQSATVMLGYATTAPAYGRLVPATTFELGPDGLTFLRTVSFSVRYDPSKIPTGLVEPSLQLYSVSGGAWVLMRGSTVNTTTHTVTGGVARAGVYAIASTPVSRVALSGAQVNGALYVGQVAQFTATLFDADNVALTGRSIAWSSSDASKVRVDATGQITGVAPGTATITASSDGQSATTSVTILAHPVADWSGATEWTTYQGNASHTGYVAVTVDPGVFSELWTKSIAAAPLNTAAAGDGNVYVSTNSYFGTQIAKALDTRTGSEKWSRDFGPIHSVDPPAFANGMVYLQTGGHEDSFMWGIDAQSGAVRFRTPYGNQWSRWYAPVVVGSTVYAAGGYYGGAYAFGAASGTQLWFASLNQYDLFTPAIANGLVYTYTGEYSPQVTVMDATAGTTSYSIKDSTFSWDGWSMNQAPVLGASSNLLAVNGGRLLSFNLAARTIGYQIKSAFTGQLALANGTIYIQNGKAIEARRESDGSLQWLWTPPEGQPTGPTIVTKNVLFASTTANTYAVDLATQRQVWAYPAGGVLSLSSQGVLFIGQTTGKLTAISVR